MAKQILIVDDEPIALTIFSRRLETNGYEVQTASDGAEMMAKLATFKPDAIVLDVMLPRVNGIQQADILGRMPGMADIPIIFHSALFAPGLTPDSVSNPHHHYLSKSAEPEELLELLKRIGV